jgi:L-histidine N-alpha-methyltransferase
LLRSTSASRFCGRARLQSCASTRASRCTRSSGTSAATSASCPRGGDASFLESVETTLNPGEALLLGVDLVKDVDRLEAAYNDPPGLTAEFNKNILLVINRELGGNFDPEGFEHVARWDRDNEWIEMALRSVRGQEVVLAELDLEVQFAVGEEMRTEISAKFRREGVEAELDAAGLELQRWWPHSSGDFALALALAQ